MNRFWNHPIRPYLILAAVIQAFGLILLVFGCATTRYEKIEPYEAPADSTVVVGKGWA